MTNDDFRRDAETYRTASDAVRVELERKWGARAAYFRAERTPTDPREVTK